MRRDAAKLIAEEERHGSSNRSKKYSCRLNPHLDYDDDFDYGPTRVSSSSRRQYGWNAKEFGDFLSPLEGFLNKNVGQQFDDVYSEFCAAVDPRSLDGHHIRTHFRSYLKYQFYVDDCGFLQKQKYDSYRNTWSDPKGKERIVDSIPVNDSLHFKKINGCWFVSEYRENDPDANVLELVRYEAGKGVYEKVRAGDQKNFKPRTLLRYRQLSKKEIREMKKLYWHRGTNVKWLERLRDTYRPLANYIQL